MPYSIKICVHIFCYVDLQLTIRCSHIANLLLYLIFKILVFIFNNLFVMKYVSIKLVTFSFVSKDIVCSNLMCRVAAAATDYPPRLLLCDARAE